MVEYTYAECTSAVLSCLSTFQKHYPDYKRLEIQNVISESLKFIENIQRPDGSFYGSWGICFTYAMFLVVEALVPMGQTYQNSRILHRACDFLVGKQRIDGGWGESFKSCEIGEWVEHESSQVVNTAWAVLALMAAEYPGIDAISNGVEVIYID